MDVLGVVVVLSFVKVVVHGFLDADWLRFRLILPRLRHHNIASLHMFLLFSHAHVSFLICADAVPPLLVDGVLGPGLDEDVLDLYRSVGSLHRADRVRGTILQVDVTLLAEVFVIVTVFVFVHDGADRLDLARLVEKVHSI